MPKFEVDVRVMQTYRVAIEAPDASLACAAAEAVMISGWRDTGVEDNPDIDMEIQAAIDEELVGVRKLDADQVHYRGPHPVPVCTDEEIHVTDDREVELFEHER